MSGRCFPNSCSLKLGWEAVAQRPRALGREVHAVKSWLLMVTATFLGVVVVLSNLLPAVLTRLCWKWEPTPIPEGEPGEGTGDELGEEWRFPVIKMPMSLSISSGNGRSTNISSRGEENTGKLKRNHTPPHALLLFNRFRLLRYLLRYLTAACYELSFCSHQWLPSQVKTVEKPQPWRKPPTPYSSKDK